MKGPFGSPWVRLVALAALAQGVALADPASSNAPSLGEAPPLGAFVSVLEGLIEPRAAAVDERGNFYVAESGANRVRCFDSTGKELWRTRDGELLAPGGVALAPPSADGVRRIFAADTGNHRVVVFAVDSADGSTATPAVERSFGELGDAAGQFNHPTGLCAGRERVWVCDTRNDRVQSFDFEGQFVSATDGGVSGRAAFARPVAIAVGQGAAGASESDRVFVLDADAPSVLVFDRDGQFLTRFGQYGPFEGLLADPSGLAFGAAGLYVAERGNHRVQVFDVHGRVRHAWGVHALRPRESGGRLHYPSGIAVTPDGERAVVCESFENRLQVFGPIAEDTPAETIRAPDLDGISKVPHYGRRGDGNAELVVLIDFEGHRVAVHDRRGESPVRIHTLGRRGERLGEFRRPTDVVLDSTEREPVRLTVLDRGNRRIQVFDLDYDRGETVRQQLDMSRLLHALDLDVLRTDLESDGRVGDLDPVAVERDNAGRIWLCDARWHRLLVYSDDGQLEATVGSFGTGDGLFRAPFDLALGPDGESVYVADRHNRRVQVFGSDGVFRRSVVTPDEPFGVAVAPDGTLWVSQPAADSVLVFDVDGGPPRRLGERGLGRVQFYKPHGLIPDASGGCLVLDHGNHRAQSLSADGAFKAAIGARLFIRPTRERGRPNRSPED